jgi:iron uptake system EfeUOB component EfeO/EfeM
VEITAYIVVYNVEQHQKKPILTVQVKNKTTKSSKLHGEVPSSKPNDRVGTPEDTVGIPATRAQRLIMSSTATSTNSPCLRSDTSEVITALKEVEQRLCHKIDSYKRVFDEQTQKVLDETKRCQTSVNSAKQYGSTRRSDYPEVRYDADSRRSRGSTCCGMCTEVTVFVLKLFACVVLIEVIISIWMKM